MSRSRKKILPFTIVTSEAKARLNLEIFNAIKTKSGINSVRIQGVKGLSEKNIPEIIDAFRLRGLIEEDPRGNGSVVLKGNPNVFLGIGFSDRKCYIVLMNLSGNILDSEEIDMELFHKFKGKRKEVVEVLSLLKMNTKFRKQTVIRCGLAIPEKIIRTGEKNISLLSEGISGIFNSDVCFCGSVTASGYGESVAVEEKRGRNILYLHSDIGWGVVIKGETIFQAEREISGGNSSYLRSWEQFGIEGIAKNLVNKGVGSSLVDMVNGDIDAINLDTVLKAAEQDDELAGDLVVRSALALGVRAAYLVNVFDVCTVILGGGMEERRGKFEEFVRESANKFLRKDLKGNVLIAGGKLGVKAASLGAANLCIRELFLEV